MKIKSVSVLLFPLKKAAKCCVSLKQFSFVQNALQQFDLLIFVLGKGGGFTGNKVSESVSTSEQVPRHRRLSASGRFDRGFCAGAAALKVETRSAPEQL